MSTPSDSKTRTNGSLDALSTSERYRLLAAERRRLVLEILAGEPPPVDLEGLATEVVAWETAGGDVDAETIKHVKIALHHNHLPALTDAGVLVYDAEANRIDPRE